MSVVQRIARAVLHNRWANSMEAESRSWNMRCQACGTERSVWDVGGIRWKASGRPLRRLWCAVCGKITTHTVERR